MTDRIFTDANGRKYINNEPRLHSPQRKPPATIDEMFDRMDKAPRGVFYGRDPMTIWMEAWRAAEQHHGIKGDK